MSMVERENDKKLKNNLFYNLFTYFPKLSAMTYLPRYFVLPEVSALAENRFYRMVFMRPALLETEMVMAQLVLMDEENRK